MSAAELPPIALGANAPTARGQGAQSAMGRASTSTGTETTVGAAGMFVRPYFIVLMGSARAAAMATTAPTATETTARIAIHSGQRRENRLLPVFSPQARISMTDSQRNDQ